MPFLRIIRDKRGYETTYLMHWYKEGNRQRSRILYVFRTPGGVRVGRAPLEPDVLRTIEAQYPDIAFDWKAVVDNQQIVEPAAELRRPRKRRKPEEESDAAAVAAGDTVKSVVPLLGGGQPSKEQQAVRPQIPASLEGATPDEQIAFLAKWYSVIRERIPQRTSDPVRQEALVALAERLNTATWTDADQITAGLQQAGEALERLSRVFSKRRRRRKPARAAAGAESAAGANIESGAAAEPAAEPAHPDSGIPAPESFPPES